MGKKSHSFTTAQNRRLVEEMLTLAHEPDKLGRMASVLEDELGHELSLCRGAGEKSPPTLAMRMR